MEILKENGWKVKETPITGDQGVDLIASIDNLRICIQCKNHKKAVGNNAVQEISAGKLYWKGTHAVLVSKSGFTKSAQKLARANKVKLINDFELKDLENILIQLSYISCDIPSLYKTSVVKIPEAHIKPLAIGIFKTYAPIYKKRKRGCNQAAMNERFESGKVIKQSMQAGA